MVHVPPGHAAEGGAFGGDIAQGHFFGALKGQGEDVRAVQVFAEDAGADGVAVKADEEIEKGGPVGDDDVFGAVFLDQGLLRKIKGVVDALLVGKAGIGKEVFQGDKGTAGQGMAAAEKYVHRRFEEGMEVHVRFLQDMKKHVFSEMVKEENAQLASSQPDVFDNIIGAGFPQGELIFLPPILLYQSHESIHHEGIVLGGNGKDPLHRGALLVGIFQKIRLFHHLPGVGKEFHPFLRKYHAPAGAAEKGNAHFLLQLSHGFGKGRLGNKKRTGRHIQRARLYDGDDVTKLLQSHGILLGKCGNREIFFYYKGKWRILGNDSLRSAVRRQETQFFIMRRSRTITLGSFGPVKPKNPFYTTCRR